VIERCDEAAVSGVVSFNDKRAIGTLLDAVIDEHDPSATRLRH